MLLIVNAGSSSLKLAIFDGAAEVARASVGEIGTDGHRAALERGLAEARVPVVRLTAAAHRVVHGGASLTKACRVTPTVLREIEACVPLAPLHNPANLVGIEGGCGACTWPAAGRVLRHGLSRIELGGGGNLCPAPGGTGAGPAALWLSRIELRGLGTDSGGQGGAAGAASGLPSGGTGRRFAQL